MQFYSKRAKANPVNELTMDSKVLHVNTLAFKLQILSFHVNVYIWKILGRVTKALLNIHFIELK